MIVSKDELEELQRYVQKQLNDLEKQSSPDSDQVFNLQALDSNISLVTSYADFQGSDALELGTRDSAIKEALTAYRSTISKKPSEDSFVGELSFYAAEAVKNILQAKSSLPSSEKVFSSNITWKLNQVLPVLKEIAGLEGNTRLVQKLKENDFAALESGMARASASRTVAKPVKVQEVKPAAAKVSTTSKSAVKESTKTTKTASKTATKTAVKTTKTAAKTSSKTVEEAPKKRGRPRKSE